MQDNICAWIERKGRQGYGLLPLFRDVITANGEDILGVLFFTDEAWFHLSHYVSSQNSHVWSVTNSHDIKDTPLRDQKVGMWCATPWNRIIGPIYLSNTVNSEQYCKRFFTPSLDIQMRTKLPAAILVGWYYRTHSSYFHYATTRCVQGQNSFKEHLGIMVAKSYAPNCYLWKAQRQTSHSFNRRKPSQTR